VIFGGEKRPTFPLYFLGQFAHRFFGDFDAFTAGYLRARSVDGGENLRTAAFPLDPKRERRLDGVFSACETAAINGLPDKILLLRGEVYLHAVNLVALGRTIKR
jgi:hypothetical protein